MITFYNSLSDFNLGTNIHFTWINKQVERKFLAKN